MEQITQNPLLNEFLQKYDKRDWNDVILKLCLISLGYLNSTNPKPVYSFDELDDVLLNFQNENNPNQYSQNNMNNSDIKISTQMMNNPKFSNFTYENKQNNKQPYDISFQKDNQNPLSNSNYSNINQRGVSNLDNSIPSNPNIRNPFENNMNMTNKNIPEYKNKYDNNPKFQSIDSLSLSNKYTYQNCVPDPCCYNPYCDPCNPCYDPCCCICKPICCPIQSSNNIGSFNNNNLRGNNYSSPLRNNYQSNNFNLSSSGLGNSNYSIRKPCPDCK